MPTAETVGCRATVAHNRGLRFPVLIVTSASILVAPLPAMIWNLSLARDAVVAIFQTPISWAVDRLSHPKPPTRERRSLCSS